MQLNTFSNNCNLVCGSLPPQSLVFLVLPCDVKKQNFQWASQHLVGWCWFSPNRRGRKGWEGEIFYWKYRLWWFFHLTVWSINFIGFLLAYFLDQGMIILWASFNLDKWIRFSSIFCKRQLAILSALPLCDSLLVCRSSAMAYEGFSGVGRNRMESSIVFCLLRFSCYFLARKQTCHF